MSVQFVEDRMLCMKVCDAKIDGWEHPARLRKVVGANHTMQEKRPSIYPRVDTDPFRCGSQEVYTFFHYSSSSESDNQTTAFNTVQMLGGAVR